jgi:PleD family two-component response regulator
MKKKILVIEDDNSIRKALKNKLLEEDFNVMEAVNGLQGLELALSRKPDLILLDIVMPLMDGLTVLKKLREDIWGRDAKVIILSNLSDAKSVETSMEQGVYNYLVKANWRIEDVMEKIRETLAQ